MSKLRVAIICGGRSSEHGISCVSAGGVLGAIDLNKYEPVLIGITQEGKWLLLPNDYPLQITNGNLPEIPSTGKAVVADLHGLSVDGESLNIDVVFPILHGPYGEDGTIQGFCEMANLPYVGSGVLASAVAMDKSFAKPIFTDHGISVATGVVITASQWKQDKKSALAKISQLKYPLFIKPARGGSSRGTNKARSESDLEGFLKDAFAFDSKVMVEEAIIGKEVECAVLERDGQVESSIPGEIVLDSRFDFYDFEAKYLDNATSITIPAPIGDVAAIQSAAVTAFKALGCSGLARIDFFVTSSGIVINEVNTMPGFTPTSVFPKLWAASGLTYSEIIDSLIATALTRVNSVLGN
jgi:D-alanine-D-alanine ligase